MFALRLLGGNSFGFETVTWVVVLVIFLTMAILGWLVASKGWLQEDQEAAYGTPEEHEGHDETAHA